MSKVHRASAPQRLRKYIQREKVTQAAVAAELGVSGGHLSDILSGKELPSLALAVRIEDLTGIPARDFAEVA